jgi:hypothetical protein
MQKIKFKIQSFQHGIVTFILTIMAKLHVIAYPELGDTDLQKIQACRKDNDRLYKDIAPHFTFVFAVQDFSESDFVAEVKKQLTGTKAFSFTIRCAAINKDSFSDYYFAFLVPDEGYSNMVKLHDRLYDDRLFHHRRLDIDYIPHIEIANAPDKMQIKSIVDEWNSIDLEIKGCVSEIEIVNYENRVLTTIEKIKLS